MDTVWCNDRNRGRPKIKWRDKLINKNSGYYVGKGSTCERKLASDYRKLSDIAVLLALIITCSEQYLESCN